MLQEASFRGVVNKFPGLIAPRKFEKQKLSMHQNTVPAPSLAACWLVLAGLGWLDGAWGRLLSGRIFGFRLQPQIQQKCCCYHRHQTPPPPIRHPISLSSLRRASCKRPGNRRVWPPLGTTGVCQSNHSGHNNSGNQNPWIRCVDSLVCWLCFRSAP